MFILEVLENTEKDPEGWPLDLYLPDPTTVMF